MQANFAQEDHAMLVGRKLSVDWSLAPALLINDIMRGEPPSHWMALLDDAYGRSTALTLDAENTPQKILDGCALIKRQNKSIRFSYLAQRFFAAGSEVPLRLNGNVMFVHQKQNAHRMVRTKSRAARVDFLCRPTEHFSVGTMN